MLVAAKQVVLNGRFLQRSVTGVERFAVEILRDLNSRIAHGSISDIEPIIAIPSGVRPKEIFSHIPFVPVGRWQGYAWEQIELPIFCAGRPLLSLCNTAPVFYKQQLVVIHDAAVYAIPQAFSTSFKLVYKLMHKLLAIRRIPVATVSHFSKRELIKHFGFDSGLLQVVSEGAEHVLRHAPDISILGRHGLAPQRYVLAVSSMAEHKNFKLVLEALASMHNPPFQVAIAGGANLSIFGDVVVEQNEHVRCLGYVSDAELRALYENALCFVFPSLYEGFGIPPLEAMICGCPVLASSAASIPEVCGDAALYFDPRSASELAIALGQVATDSSCTLKLSDAGRARVSSFSWAQATNEVLASFSRLWT